MQSRLLTVRSLCLGSLLNLNQLSGFPLFTDSLRLRLVSHQNLLINMFSRQSTKWETTI